MSVRDDNLFKPIPYDAAKVAVALRRIVNEVVGPGAQLKMRGTVMPPSGMKITLKGDSLSFPFKLSPGSGQYLEIEVFGRSEQYLHINLFWKQFFSCNMSGDNESDLYQIIDILSSEFDLQPYDPTEVSAPPVNDNAIAVSLAALDDTLYRRYRQACKDTEDEGRLSYNGAIYDFRDVLVGVLHKLAPDDEVINQPEFKQVDGTRGPTQKQRGRYILTVLRNRGGNVVDSDVTTIDLVATLARQIYDRACLAHTEASRDEAVAIRGYVENLLADLLGIQGR